MLNFIVSTETPLSDLTHDSRLIDSFDSLILYTHINRTAVSREKYSMILFLTCLLFDSQLVISAVKLLARVQPAQHGGFGWARYTNFAATPLLRPARQNRHATQASESTLQLVVDILSFSPRQNSTPAREISGNSTNRRDKNKQTKVRQCTDS